MSRNRLDALFPTQVYFGSKFCPDVLEIIVVRVPARYIRDFALLNVTSSSKNYPSARHTSAATLFAGTFTYLETKAFSLIIFYNGPCII
jgi:hypothetical protein